jgi:hypothetical protein
LDATSSLSHVLADGGGRNVAASPIAKAYLINRADRPDRLRACKRNMARIGWTMPTEVWPAVIAAEARGFPSAAVRGCFLSHLGVLREARRLGLARVLILEDDCDLDATAINAIGLLNASYWELAYLGHNQELTPTQPFSACDAERRVLCLHCYAVDASVLGLLVGFFESCIDRSNERSPAYPDGALNMFRAAYPDVRTLLASPPVAFQRSTRSDLAPSWFDRVPGLRQLAEQARVIRGSRSTA